MNDVDLNKLNNTLNFIEGLFKASYVLSNEKVQELYEKGLLDTPAHEELKLRNEEALERFTAKGYKVVEFNRYLQPELLNALKNSGMKYTLIKDSKTNNIVVCYDERQSAKMRAVEKSIYENCKSFTTNMNTLKKINETMENATIRTTKGLSDFQYHVLCEKLPEYGVTFAGNIVRDGLHKISFSSVDDQKVLQCVKDCANFLCTPDGIETMKRIHTENKIFKSLEQAVKNGETSYIVSSQSGISLKVEPNQLTILKEDANGRLSVAPVKNNPIEGNVFKNNTWKNITQQVLEMKQPVILDENEAMDYFAKSLQDREDIIEAKTEALESTFILAVEKTPYDYEKEMTPDTDIGQSKEAPALEDLE